MFALYQKELRQYQNHHRHPNNILIHVISVPLEWLGISFLSGYLGFHWFMNLCIACVLFTLSTRAAQMAGLMHFLLAYITSLAYESWMEDPGRLILWGVVLQIGAWFVQVIIGHYTIERNSPSMSGGLSLLSVIVSLALSWES